MVGAEGHLLLTAKKKKVWNKIPESLEHFCTSRMRSLWVLDGERGRD